MKKSYFKSLLIVFVCAFCGLVARAAVPIFSQYGQIQNVQNYSTNPFWSPNAPYNQRLPQPVYVQGADLNADDCIKVVQSLVAAQCMARDNCKNTDLTEIRPTIMVQLSNLPGANYVSACSGYLDGVFESYVQQYGNTLPNRPTAFPSATVPNPDLNDSGGIKFENPYKQQPTKWQMEIRERSEELQSLQNENGADNYNVSATDFPMTYQDVSFYERMENERAGLEPYKDMVAYKTINANPEAEWCSDSSHYNSAECAAYKAKQEAAAQAVASQTAATQNQETNISENNPTEQTKYVARIRKRHAIRRNSYDGSVSSDGKGCYAVCGQPVNDNLNNKALNEVMGQNYCARTTDGMLVENENRDNVLTMDQHQLDKIKGLITSRVFDQDKCDGHFRNYIMFVGKFASDGSFTELEEIFLDD